MSDSEYEYESENEYESEHDSENEFNNDSENYLQYKFLDHLAIIPIEELNKINKNTNQYQWILTCFKIYYNINNPLICEYNFDKNNLEFLLKHNKKICKIYVMKDLEYPYHPFIIDYIGDNNINLYNQLLLTKNKILLKSNWNICTDIYQIINNILHILTLDDNNQCITNHQSLNNAIINIANIINLNFEFDLIDKLPNFGINLNSNINNNSTYSWKGTDKFNSLNELIINDIQFISNIINTNPDILDNIYYNKLFYLILDEVLNIKLTKLEISAHQEFYNYIINIIKKTNYSYDLSIFESSNNINEIAKTSKFTMIEDFKYHTYKETSLNITSKLTKRIFAELETITETINDFDCYVITSENNICLFKLLFIPDSTTPYAYGFFEFDLFIPGDYPNSPPKIKFLTTGNGKVRFNPNLYNCGKVCLSIINTWSTNQWNPTSSTISQVILSIQTMIFNEHPYTNEPAYYNSLNTPQGLKQSQLYNTQIQKYTIQYAIKEAFNNLNSSFHSIIHSKYLENKQIIEEHYSIKLE